MPSPHSQGLPNQFPSIPEPSTDNASIRETVMRLKEAVELLTAQRGVSGDTEYSIQGALRQISQGNSRVIELRQVDEELASQLTLVETKVDDVTVQGQVVLRSQSTPTGYKAYFGVYLKATVDSAPGTERYAGFSLGLTNSNGGVASFDVAQFMLRDVTAPTPKTVFDYVGGKFVFTGDVSINGTLVVTGSITGTKLVDLTVPTAKVALNAITSANILTSSTNTVQFSMALRQGSTVAILATYHPPNSVYTGIGPANPLLSLSVDGVVFFSPAVPWFTFNNGSTVTNKPMPVTALTNYNVPADDNYLIKATTDITLAGAFAGTMSLLAIELAR